PRPLLLAGMAKEARDRPSAARLRRDLDQAARGHLGDSWRENGRAWLAGAAASRAGDPLPVLADPAGDGDGEDFLPELTGATQRSGDGRRWRVLAGAATAVAALLVVVVVAARALTGPATSPAPTAPGLPLFGGSPSASVAPTQVSVSATPLESETAVSTSTPQPTAPTPRPTSDQTISFAPVSTPTPTA